MAAGSEVLDEQIALAEPDASLEGLQGPRFWGSWQRTATRLRRLILSAILTLTVLAASTEWAPRQDALLHVVSAAGAKTTAGTSFVVRATSRAFEAPTDLSLDLFEPTRLSGCPARARLACLVRAASEEVSTFVVIASVQPLEGARDRIEISLVDLASAKEIIAEHRDLETTEDAIFRSIVRAPAIVYETEDTSSFETRLERTVEDVFAPTLERRGHWRPFGRITLGVPCEGCALTVGGRTLGSPPLAEAPPGPHRIVLTRSEAPIWICDVHVERGGTAVMNAEVCRDAPSRDRTGHPALVWGSVVSGVLAIGAVAYGVERAASGPTAYCVPNGASCPGVGFARTGIDTDGPPSTDPRSSNASGVPLVPLGLGLLTTSATWLAGHLAVESERWWWSALAGLVTGGLVFTATALAGAP